MDGHWGSGIGKKKQRAQGDWSDDELPEIDFATEVKVRKRTTEKKKKAQGNWSDDELPEIDFDETEVKVGKRTEKKKQRAQGDWSDDEMPSIDFEYDIGDTSEKDELRHKQSIRDAPKVSVSKDAAAPSSKTRHHCILSGHIFRRERVPLRQDQRVGQRTKFDLEEKRERCEDCKKDVVEKLWVCEIPVCGRRVCGTCKRGWDGEQAKRARESWRR